MVDKVTVPTARASILWLIGEYSDRISKLAPDVLRKMAKSFPDEVCLKFCFDLIYEFLYLGNNC
jgi:vesicle coat complex subunit